MDGVACIAGEVQAGFAQAIQLAFVDSVTCGHTIANTVDDVATEVHIALFNGDEGRTGGVTYADAIGAVSGLVA